MSSALESEGHGSIAGELTEVDRGHGETLSDSETLGDSSFTETFNRTRGTSRGDLVKGSLTAREGCRDTLGREGRPRKDIPKFVRSPTGDISPTRVPETLAETTEGRIFSYRRPGSRSLN